MEKISSLILFTFFSIFILEGCTLTPNEFNSVIKEYEKEIEKTRTERGEKCSPSQLAYAEAYLKFAKIELNRGELIHAENHLEKVANELSNSRTEIAKCPKDFEDKDHDGIADSVDSCPDAPEDYDGYQDEDGCPEKETADRDNDGIPDFRDKCPTKPEDYDGFEDKDGCPDIDLDKDKDGILDKKDKCPNEPEDIDKFRDKDGCPDPDNDSDGILDVGDKCPNVPGVVHRAGCPEPQY